MLLLAGKAIDFDSSGSQRIFGATVKLTYIFCKSFQHQTIKQRIIGF
jgi:hypothetical protein